MKRLSRSERRNAVILGIGALFDLSGIVTYRIIRYRMVAEKSSESATDPFRSSAELISAAFREVTEC